MQRLSGTRVPACPTEQGKGKGFPLSLPFVSPMSLSAFSFSLCYVSFSPLHPCLFSQLPLSFSPRLPLRISSPSLSPAVIVLTTFPAARKQMPPSSSATFSQRSSPVRGWLASSAHGRGGSLGEKELLPSLHAARFSIQLPPRDPSSPALRRRTHLICISEPRGREEGGGGGEGKP